MIDGWREPVSALEELRTAVKHLLSREPSPRIRFEGATQPLTTWQHDDVPEVLRQHLVNVLDARRRVRADYPGGTLFEFDRLSAQERNAIAASILALYEACLIDIGRMDRAGRTGEGYAEIAYPKPTTVLTVRPRST